jgi:hypothetical protein
MILIIIMENKIFNNIGENKFKVANETVKSTNPSVVYIGAMEYRNKKIELFNALKQIGPHVEDSTLSRETLTQYGIEVPSFDKLVVGQKY